METSLADQRVLTAAMPAEEMSAPPAHAVAVRAQGCWMVDLRTARVVRRTDRDSCPGAEERPVPGAGW